MKKTDRKKPSFFMSAFFVLALIFLAFGLGTLGSVQGVGKPYEMMKSGNDEFSVVFRLENPKKELKAGGTETTYMRYRKVYLNLGGIYAEEDATATLRLNWGTSTSSSSLSSSSREMNAKFENVLPEKVEDGKESTAVKADFGNWIEPFGSKLTTTEYAVSTYPYFKLTIPKKDGQPSVNVLINEIVFVGEVLTGSGGEGTGEYRVIPASVYSATLLSNESTAQAKARASALVDCQYMPTLAQSSFFRYGGEEIAMTMTLAQMRLGNTFGTGNVYYGDTVYNSFGTSLLAFGTLIFGSSPFGLRFFPMLASFGILVIGFFFAKKLFGSEKAGFAFALVYALCNFSFGFGHLGTPLMIGVFFLFASLYCCWLFYANGLARAGAKDAAPLAVSGLCGAAAVCVNGAMIIPVAGVAGLFVLGLMRQLKERRVALDLAIEEAEAEEAGTAPVAQVAEGGEAEPTGKEKVARVLSDYRRKNTVAPAAFFTSLIIGGLLFSLLFLLPVYYVAIKLYDNPASPTSNIFYLAAKLFAGGFTGANVFASDSAWSVVHYLFRGTGEWYAITAVVTNGVAALFGLAGIAYAVYRIVTLVKNKEGFGAAFVTVVTPLAGIVVSLLVAIFAKGAVAFTVLAYLFAFLLAAGAVKYFTEQEGKIAKTAKIVCVTGVVMLAIGFAIFAVFTFSLPLPASCMARF